MWNIGYVPVPRPMLILYRIDPQGAAREGECAADGPARPHPRLRGDGAAAGGAAHALRAGSWKEFTSGHTPILDAHVWRPELGVRVLVVDKDSLEVERRHELPPGFHFHHGNGWEEADGTIRFDLCQAPDPSFVIRDFRERHAGRHPHPVGAPGLSAGRPPPRRPRGIRARTERVAADFPRIDPRRLGRRHEMTFALAGVEEPQRLAAPAGGPLCARTRRTAGPGPGTGYRRSMSSCRAARMKGKAGCSAPSWTSGGALPASPFSRRSASPMARSGKAFSPTPCPSACTAHSRRREASSAALSWRHRSG